MTSWINGLGAFAWYEAEYASTKDPKMRPDFYWLEWFMEDK